MKVWRKPAVREQEVGLEVTSYLPAEIDIICKRSELADKAAIEMLDRRFSFWCRLERARYLQGVPTAMHCRPSLTL